MKKVTVIGCPGSGKSTFSRALNAKTDLPLFHLDMLQWNQNRTTVPPEVFLERLDAVLSQSEWIIDGNYISTMEKRIKKSDTVIFLDYPLNVCLSGIEERRGKVRPDMPWTEETIDDAFLTFIKNFEKDTRPHVLELLNRYSDKTIITFENREAADEFLKL